VGSARRAQNVIDPTWICIVCLIIANDKHSTCDDSLTAGSDMKKEGMAGAGAGAVVGGGIVIGDALLATAPLSAPVAVLVVVGVAAVGAIIGWLTG
jgi:hypothetical protein